MFSVVTQTITQRMMFMKLAVISANGKAGKLITDEAVSRGLDVTAIVRGENKTSAPHALKRDIMEVTAEDLKGFDVVVNAYGGWTPEALAMHTPSLMHICDALSGTQTRLLVVGGAGSLYVNPEHTVQLYQTPNFPEDYKPIATAQVKELDALRKRNDVRWTFISPAADFRADGERTGKYILAGEEFTVNSRGESIISYADYAVAVVDEAVKGNHVQQRISVVKE
ncbi:MAG: NAD(P)-dependent oxidoreductase [Synergistaceae bacterium]|nr:NAD(P)-dependent oxidoreductase [Synergistaceae bacterium]